jgi:ABC-type iron transport system FetAB permease component
MLIRRSEKRYVVALSAAVLLILWCGFEIIFMFNVAAVGYLAVGVMSALASVLLLRPAPHPSAEPALPAGS